MTRPTLYAAALRGRPATVEEILDEEGRPHRSYPDAELKWLVATPTRAALHDLYATLTGRSWSARSSAITAVPLQVRADGYIPLPNEENDE